MFPKLLLSAPILAALLWLCVACGGPAPAPTPAALPVRPSVTLSPGPTRTPFRLGEATPASALNLQGTFVYAPGDGSVWLQDATGANPRPLVKASAETFAESPQFSPDGKQVVYALSTLTREGLVLKDLRIIQSDGAGERVLIKPDQPRISYSFPTYSPDGKEVFFTQSFPQPPSGEQAEISRLALGGGPVRKVLDGGRSPSVSPDGRKIAYLKFDYKTFTSSMWVANLDGSAPQQLVDQETFLGLIGPRFSPDSKRLLFSASGPPNKKLPGVSHYTPRHTPGACALGLGPLCLVERAYADGLPWDLWVANADGSRFEQITRIGSDSPYPAWSPDGKYAAFLDLTGIHAVDLQRKTLHPVTLGGGHGGLDWR